MRLYKDQAEFAAHKLATRVRCRSEVARVLMQVEQICIPAALTMVGCRRLTFLAHALRARLE